MTFLLFDPPIFASLALRRRIPDPGSTAWVSGARAGMAPTTHPVRRPVQAHRQSLADAGRSHTERPANLPKGWDSARDSPLPGPIGASTASLVTHSEEEVRRPPRSAACERWQCMTTLPSLPGIFPRGRHSEHDSRQSLRRTTGPVHRTSDRFFRPSAQN